MPSQNLILYAKWTINQYTITFETNGGNPIQTQTYNYNSNLNIPNPTKVGHSFAGWFMDVVLTRTFTQTNMPAHNITLYANWLINQYTIIFETNGGTEIASITGKFGDPITSPNNPTREGYTFNGWFANADLTQSITVPTIIPAENLSFYAGWLPLSPRILIDKTPVYSYHSGQRGARGVTTVLPDMHNFYGPNNNGLYQILSSFNLVLYDFQYSRCIYLYKVNFEGQEPIDAMLLYNPIRIQVDPHLKYGTGTFNLNFRFMEYGESWDFGFGFYNLSNGYYVLKHRTSLGISQTCPTYFESYF